MNAIKFYTTCPWISYLASCAPSELGKSVVFFLEDAQMLVTGVSAASSYSLSLSAKPKFSKNQPLEIPKWACWIFGQHLLAVLLLPGLLLPGLLLPPLTWVLWASHSGWACSCDFSLLASGLEVILMSFALLHSTTGLSEFLSNLLWELCEILWRKRGYL